MNNEISELGENKVIHKNKRPKGVRPITCKINPNIRNNYHQINNHPQSPKIKTNEFRCNSQPRLFSLIDIKDRYHSKTTSVPNQYKRKIYSKIDKLLYDKNSDIYKIPQIDYDLIKKTIKNKTMSTIDIDKKDEKEEEKEIEEEKVNKKKEKKLRRNKSQENLNANYGRIQSAIVSRKERLYKPIYWNNAEISKKQRDKYMPEGYEYFEKKNLKEFNQNYLKNNYVKNINIDSNHKKNKNLSSENSHILLRKLNQLKQHESDIFFMKNKDINKEENKNQTIAKQNLYKFTDSDIFNLKNNDPIIIEKSGERSFFRNLKNISENIKNVTYNMNNETLLGWKLRNPLPSLYNYTSTQYHLLNRNIKNIGKTKETVFNECKKLPDNFNPIHKQKSLCEFIDLCRVSAPKINNDYNKAINMNPNVFRRKNESSSEFFDIYNHYNSICDKPFQKFNPIKDTI